MKELKSMMELVGEEAKVLDYEFAKEAGFVAVSKVCTIGLNMLLMEIFIKNAV